MTSFMPPDTDLSNQLTAYIKAGVSWLRHREGAGRLDWALLHGATSEELNEFRKGWKGHIMHLREVHGVNVAEEPEGIYRIVGASPLATDADIHADDSDEDDVDDAGEDVDQDGDPDAAIREEDADAVDATCHGTAAIAVRPRHTANALMALHQAGELANPLHKAAVGMLIRQVTECLHHWHNSTHYRSHAAAEAIKSAGIRTAAQYQEFCRRNLRHEHMVPNIVLYRLILRNPAPTVPWLLDLFARYSLRATITREEDRRLRASDMPPAFYVTGTELYELPLARYVEVGMDRELVRRTTPRWFEL